MKNIIFFLNVVSVLLLLSCNNDIAEDTPKEEAIVKSTANKGQAYVVDEESEPNVLQVAQSLPDFSTLVAAIEAGGVADALVNTGPLTVFAPTNEAFAKLPEGTIETLLEPENKSTLSFVLTNHVAPANYPDTQLEKEAKKGRKLYMASGVYLDVIKKEDGLYVGGSKILKTVKVSNGWIHVIDDVLVPPEEEEF